MFVYIHRIFYSSEQDCNYFTALLKLMAFKHYIVIFWITVLQNLYNSQGSAVENYETNNSSQSFGCIDRYRDLESYILNHRDIMNKITETFFETGKTASRFVRITYNMQVSYSTGEYNYTASNDTINCTNLQSQYIWSESPVFLLGPKPLFWFTLFAINVRETSVAIDLPCLCRGMHYNLLSRLTYLVRKVYAYELQYIMFWTRNSTD